MRYTITIDFYVEESADDLAILKAEQIRRQVEQDKTAFDVEVIKICETKYGSMTERLITKKRDI